MSIVYLPALVGPAISNPQKKYATQAEIIQFPGRAESEEISKLPNIEWLQDFYDAKVFKALSKSQLYNNVLNNQELKEQLKEAKNKKVGIFDDIMLFGILAAQQIEKCYTEERLTELCRTLQNVECGEILVTALNLATIASTYENLRQYYNVTSKVIALMIVYSIFMKKRKYEGAYTKILLELLKANEIIVEETPQQILMSDIEADAAKLTKRS